ncbi:ral GTPase-activating protein subunit alpha-2 [Grus japonensis]|uniref:Ral GTPase-activating protein subunit alpha-2 n=1 Tax=Grus japonensis TaxID=30415 RepID=A0ABC9WR94_GRUJA
MFRTVKRHWAVLVPSFPCPCPAWLVLLRIRATPSVELIRICNGLVTAIAAGCLTTSASADLTVTIGIELADQTSPTLPRASKSRVSGKLRRSASALSKSSN